MDQLTQGLQLLGLQLLDGRGDAGASTAPMEGMSTVVAPLLLSEVLRAQATAHGELLPADGPVKVMDDSTAGSGPRDDLANALEKDFNTFLTRVRTEYYPDTDRMLFYTVFCGSGFKKIYHCPLRRSPVSESVDAMDLIVNAGAPDLANAQRITHVIPMRTSMVKRMMLAGAYRDVPLGQAFAQPNPAAQTSADIAGIDVNSQQPQDQNHTIYEVNCEWDLGEGPDGLHLPYRVTIDKDSRQVLEVRRNWRDGDDLYKARETYVRYPYIDAIGFYGLGLLHLLGNTSKALTAAERMMLDAGMFSSFPGFLYSDVVARQDTNEMRVPPGGGQKVTTGGRPINDVVMKLPYQPPSPVLMEFAQYLEGSAKAMAGSAELPVGEGHAQMPVGTMLAMLEQATKPMSAVHKRLHAAQSKEFQLLADLLREDPEAFWRDGRRGIYSWDKETFIRALDSFELAPVSDPNSPTKTHRLMKAQAVKMLQQASPQLYDGNAVDSHILRLLGFANPQEFFIKTPMPPMPNPAMAAVQQRAAEAAAKIQQQNQSDQIRLVEAHIKAQTDAANRDAKAKIEGDKLAVDRQRLGMEAAAEGIKGAHDAHNDDRDALADSLEIHQPPTPTLENDHGVS
ncbi:MAG TPA: hypothetical protein PKX13_12040 [Acidiphilium sp.]|nr:hypothetical protein [Acidiphilium sp.]